MRTGMSALVERVRQLADAGTAEYSLAGETYYSDDQIEERLDRYRKDFYEPLYEEPRYESGSAVYYDYYFGRSQVEQAGSGTAAWQVEDGAGSALGTAGYTVNYEARHIRFSADQGGTPYYLRGRAFDVNRTVSDIWYEKAANVAARFDIKTDNHDLKRSQLRASYLQMGQQFARMAQPLGVPGSNRLRRVDAR